jgi:MFS family permease
VPTTRLSPVARRILLVSCIDALGTGFTLPFLLIYLHTVRGIPLPVTGFVLATLGVVGVAAGPMVGTAIDRFGARPVLAASLAVSTVGALLVTQIGGIASAFGAVAVLGLGGASAWPAMNALLAGVTAPEQRPRVFAIEVALLNGGIGLGGIAGGLLADTSRPGTFQLLYVVDAATFAIAAVALAALSRGVGGPVAAPPENAGDPGGWREVLRDRTMRSLCVLMLIVVSAGYAQLESGFPAFATGVAGVSPRTIGVAFAINTGVIVLAQLVVLKWLEGRRRTRAVAGFAIVIACSWGLLGVSTLSSPAVAATLVVVSLGVFALGETLWSPTTNAMLNDLAPPHLRGRYNALGALTWQLAMIVGPIMAGLVLGAGRSGAYLATLMLACAAAVALALGLERRLTPAQNGIAEALPAPPHVPATASS